MLSESEKLDAFGSIKDTMRFKGMALEQIEEFQEALEALGLRWRVVAQHRSKSIGLPVIKITTDRADIYFRDNFDDLNFCVCLDEPLNLSYNEMFEGLLNFGDWDWYLDEIASARGYSWKRWSDEQMDDPNILQVGDSREVTPDEKKRWMRRLVDTSWWGEDWSRGTLSYDGALGPGVKLWKQRYPFLQGIDKVVSQGCGNSYVPGTKAFAFATGRDNLQEKLRVLISKVDPDAFKDRDTHVRD